MSMGSEEFFNFAIETNQSSAYKGNALSMSMALAVPKLLAALL
jgi:hypothetical protein